MNRQTGNQTALITGASGGIGFEFAKLLAQRKWNLVLVSRDGQKLRQIADTLSAEYNIRCLAVPADLSAGGSAEVIFDILRSDNLSVDMLINNAGFGVWGSFSETDLQEDLNEVEVNISSILRLTKLFLPGMLARKQGMILNVASTAGFAPGPFMAVYYATKAFVLSFSESLSEEFRRSGVSVSVLCPGPTLTNFQKRAGIDRLNLTRRIFTMDASTVAEIGLRGLMKRKAVIVPGLRNKLLLIMIRLQPRSFVRSVAGILNANRR